MLQIYKIKTNQPNKYILFKLSSRHELLRNTPFVAKRRFCRNNLKKKLFRFLFPYEIRFNFAMSKET